MSKAKATPKKSPAKKRPVVKSAAPKKVAKKSTSEKVSTVRPKAQPGDKRLGNQFWMLRSKHGRERLFASPKELWEAACEYFQWCADNPFYETVVQKLKVNRDTEKIEMVEVPKMRPFTIHGLCSYLDCNEFYFNQFEKSLKDKEDDISKDFSLVITRIRETIFNQKFSGAASGFLKESIVALELGLKNKIDVTTDDQSLNNKPDYSGLSTDELNTLLLLQKKING